ncbi:TPA: hypothetical protein ACMEV1_005630 [Klebsiella variicola subsp. variicola]|uniref:hypothetical protein n=1 Tax=Klebsiella variicola TaxID=244366 RepID=UPI00254C7633|nr:hypothetical protein [Klebsiella variicola]MEC6197763.1 hypothetical protein [Klebsiella variicola]HCQ8411501.1 hypothetical protein [Klebsiella variicola]
MKQVSIHTLTDVQSAEDYFHIHWSRYMVSLPFIGINVNQVYQGENRQVIAIVTYKEGVDIQALNQKYMASTPFRADMHGFDMSSILKV